MLKVLEAYRELFPETGLDALCGLEGEMFKRIQNRRTFRIQRGGRGFFVKCHQGVGWHEIVKNLLAFKLPVLGAVNEWLAILRLRELGVTLRPVARLAQAAQALGADRTGVLPADRLLLGVAAAFTIVAGAVLVIGCTGGRDFSCGFWGG